MLLVWVYYSAQIFVLGAEFTWVYAHSHGSCAKEPEPEAPQAIPARSESAGAKLALAPEPVASKPVLAPELIATRRSARPQPASLEGFIQQNPLKTLGGIAAFALLLGTLLRHLAPPEKLVRHRRTPAHLDKKLTRMRELVNKWGTRPRRGLFRRRRWF